MNTPLEISINNLVEHCQAVPTALGSPGIVTPDLSTNPHTLEIPYPQVITRGGIDNSVAHSAEIEQFIASHPGDPTTGVVDSYSNLDLTQLGFDTRFSTQWAFRAPGEIELEHQATAMPEIEVVENVNQLFEFDRAAAIGFGQHGSQRVYADGLLKDRRYQFLFIRVANDIAAGVQTFTNDGSVGLYTLFTLPDYRRKRFASALVRAALSKSPQLPATTNPGDMSDKLFENIGFQNIGTRTVWIRRLT